MRKYDKRNKIYFGIVLVASLILIIIFSFFIAKVIKNGKIEYFIDAGAILYDKDKNLIKLESESVLKIKWNDEYYLMEDKNMYLLGTNGIIYNPNKDIMQLYGKYYEVTSSGEDNVVVYEDETVIRTTESKFLKIADRKYLIIDPVIKTENGSLNTKNYLIVELDKMGNATLLNNEVNLKTFEPTTIITSNFTFDIANEQLTISDQIIDLKKIIGSTNQYVKPKEKPSDGEDNNPSDNNQGNNSDNNSGNNQGNTGGNTGGNTEEGGTSEGQTGGNNNNDDENIDDIIDKTKTTSIISVNPSVGNISIDYVIYDPLNEYESVFVEVRDNNNTLVSVGYFDKMNTNFIITGLKANITYNLTFKYVYYREGVRVEEKFDEASVTVGKPNISLRVDKITSKAIYYTVLLDKDYSLDTLTVNLVSDLEGGGKVEYSNTFDSNTLANKESVSGSFSYSDIGQFATLYINNVKFSGYPIDIDAKYKVVMK